MKHKFFDSLNLISKLTAIVCLVEKKTNEIPSLLFTPFTVRYHKFSHFELHSDMMNIYSFRILRLFHFERKNEIKHFN